MNGYKRFDTSVDAICGRRSHKQLEASRDLKLQLISLNDELVTSHLAVTNPVLPSTDRCRWLVKVHIHPRWVRMESFYELKSDTI
jgi:hypothetical protein